MRDATHTLNGILDNQTVPPIEEHTTDTHGYTEIILGAYDLLGLRFAPRIRDLDRQRVCLASEQKCRVSVSGS